MPNTDMSTGRKHLVPQVYDLDAILPKIFLHLHLMMDGNIA